MTNQYKRFTLAEHITHGNMLKAAHRVLFQVLMNFPKASRISQAARRVEKSLGILQSRLDDEVCQLVSQERDPRGLATHVYYGEPIVKADTPAEATDAFAGWDDPERHAQAHKDVQ